MMATAVNLNSLLWADWRDRAKLQQHGVNVIPAHFYSNTPSIAEVQASYEYASTEPPYLDEKLFDAEALRQQLAALVPFAAEFQPPYEGNPETCRSYFWNNDQFSFSDAMTYYALLRSARPKRVVEIGSGFSSLVALEALRRNGSGTLRCIEPFPRPFITALAADGQLELDTSRAQDVRAESLNDLLEDGDVLFIDSTHTVKTGSDCMHIYLRLLPKIRRRVLVHAHDIFLPFGMPQHWMIQNHIYWTEQYLLLALLIDNPRVRLLYGSAYHHHFNRELLETFMHGRCAPGGGSFWFEYDGRDGAR
jgi:hypothetical protein